MIDKMAGSSREYDCFEISDVLAIMVMLPLMSALALGTLMFYGSVCAYEKVFRGQPKNN